MFSVQVIWTLKQRACEKMLVRWIRKDTSQLHDFDWEVSLIVPPQAEGDQFLVLPSRPGVITTFGFRECPVSCAVSSKSYSDNLIG